MKQINYDFLRKLVGQETSTPLVAPRIDFVCRNDEMSPLGAFVWNARVHMGLSSEAFAEQCDVDAKEINDLENDSEFIPDIRSVYSISKFLNIDNKVLAELSGLIKIRDQIYKKQLYSFAASSKRIREHGDVNFDIFEQYLAILHERSQEDA